MTIISDLENVTLADTEMKIVIGCLLFLILTGCQTLSDLWHGKPSPPVTAVEWNETKYKILIQQVANLSVTEAQLQAECNADRANALNDAITEGKYSEVIICPTVADDLKRAKYLLQRQEKARQLSERY